MEQLNRVELKGRIGSIRITETAGKRMAVMSVATDHIYKNVAGKVSIDTCWMRVTGWEGPKVSLDGLEKGSAVHLTGRLRNVKYVDENGLDHNTVEVLAQSIEKIEKETEDE